MLDSSPFTRLLVEKCPPTVEQDYCCHAYALQVHKDAEILKYHGEIFVDLNQAGKIISAPFFKHLFKKGLLETVKNDEAKNHDIIVYLDSSRNILHSGRLKDGRVISKFGGRAQNPITKEVLLGKDVWLHHWEDVPRVYSDAGKLSIMFIRIKKGITAEEIKNHLLAFREVIKPGIKRS